ncbi:MAG: sugar ABC transporter permease [Clostridia bacterium]|nr:sugar ABC transporter permease [Clostridia bacterium]
MNSQKKIKHNRKKGPNKCDIEMLILALPALLFFVIFHYIPMMGVVIAFKDYSYNLGLFGSKWVGLRNFEFFFTSQDAWMLTRNTVGYAVLFLVVGTFASVFVALLLNEIKSKAAIKIYQTSMILPYFLSWVIVGYITYVLFNPKLGVLNHMLAALGMREIDWYSETKYWPFILTIVNTWKAVGMNSIFYYSSLLSVDPALYEAAEIDGATRFQRMLSISLPSLTPTITVLTILAVGNIFRGDFGLFFQIPRNVGVLYPVTDIIDTYVYRGLRFGDVGITAAVGLFQSVVGMVTVIATNMIVNKINPENAMF